MVYDSMFVNSNCTTYLLWNFVFTYISQISLQTLLQFSGFSVWKVNPSLKESSLVLWS